MASIDKDAVPKAQDRQRRKEKFCVSFIDRIRSLFGKKTESTGQERPVPQPEKTEASTRKNGSGKSSGTGVQSLAGKVNISRSGKRTDTGKKEEGTLLTKTCKECGKSITYSSTWKHIPNYCKDCKNRYAQEHKHTITRKCRECGKPFTFSSTKKHYPSYCQECWDKRKVEKKANRNGG